MMHDMIVKPAECAGLKIPKKLIRRLIQETGSDTGNLPLLAFVLQRLFEKRHGDTLSEAAYGAFGGVEGAIREHVKAAEEQIAKETGPGAIDRLPEIFSSLLVVGLEGRPTRRRAPKTDFSAEAQPVVDLLIREQLLCTEGSGKCSTVSVAHEKLFDAWPALAGWIAANRDDLMLLRQAGLAAREWAEYGYHHRYIWHADRHKRLQGIIARLGGRQFEQIIKEFTEPRERLVGVLLNDALTHRDRQRIGELLGELGDRRPGVGL